MSDRDKSSKRYFDLAGDFVESRHYSARTIKAIGDFATWLDERGAAETTVRPCTCHPDDNPPRPCPQKFALTECRRAAEQREDAEYYRHNRDVIGEEWSKLRKLLQRFVTSWEGLPGHENMDRLCEEARTLGCAPEQVKTKPDETGSPLT